MTGFDWSKLATLIILGVASAIAGYLLRRLEKFEDVKDNFRSSTLTQISTAGKLLIESIEHFVKEDINKEALVKFFGSVESTLKTQIFEQGGVALLEEEKRKTITDFYFTFLMVSQDSNQYDEEDLRIKFSEEGQEIGGTTKTKIIEMVGQVQKILDNELRFYRWKLPIIIFSIIGLLTLASVIITYIEGILNPA